MFSQGCWGTVPRASNRPVTHPFPFSRLLLAQSSDKSFPLRPLDGALRRRLDVSPVAARPSAALCRFRDLSDLNAGMLANARTRGATGDRGDAW